MSGLRSDRLAWLSSAVQAILQVCDTSYAGVPVCGRSGTHGGGFAGTRSRRRPQEQCAQSLCGPSARAAPPGCLLPDPGLAGWRPQIAALPVASAAVPITESDLPRHTLLAPVASAAIPVTTLDLPRRTLLAPQRQCPLAGCAGTTADHCQWQHGLCMER